VDTFLVFPDCNVLRDHLLVVLEHGRAEFVVGTEEFRVHLLLGNDLCSDHDCKRAVVGEVGDGRGGVRWSAMLREHLRCQVLGVLLCWLGQRHECGKLAGDSKASEFSLHHVGPVGSVDEYPSRGPR